MATIGGQTCTYLRGTLSPLRQRSKTWSLPGIDGYGIVLLGLGNSQCELLAERLDSLANVGTWAYAVQALQGQIVSVENDLGESSSNLFIQAVSNVQVTAAVIPGTITTARGVLRIAGVIVA